MRALIRGASAMAGEIRDWGNDDGAALSEQAHMPQMLLDQAHVLNEKASKALHSALYSIPESGGLQLAMQQYLLSLVSA